MRWSVSHSIARLLTITENTAGGRCAPWLLLQASDARSTTVACTGVIWRSPFPKSFIGCEQRVVISVTLPYRRLVKDLGSGFTPIPSNSKLPARGAHNRHLLYSANSNQSLSGSEEPIAACFPGPPSPSSPRGSLGWESLSRIDQLILCLVNEIIEADREHQCGLLA